MSRQRIERERPRVRDIVAGVLLASLPLIGLVLLLGVSPATAAGVALMIFGGLLVRATIRG